MSLHAIATYYAHWLTKRSYGVLTIKVITEGTYMLSRVKKLMS